MNKSRYNKAKYDDWIKESRICRVSGFRVQGAALASSYDSNWVSGTLAGWPSQIHGGSHSEYIFLNCCFGTLACWAKPCSSSVTIWSQTNEIASWSDQTELCSLVSGLFWVNTFKKKMILSAYRLALPQPPRGPWSWWQKWRIASRWFWEKHAAASCTRHRWETSLARHETASQRLPDKNKQINIYFLKVIFAWYGCAVDIK